MIISIDRTSNFCGLNYNNLQLPAMQKYLRSQGCTITFIGTERVSIENDNGLIINGHFSKQIQKIELQAQQEKNKPQVHLPTKPKNLGEEAGFNALLMSSLLVTTACVGASIMFPAPLLIAFAVVFSTISLVLTGMYFLSHDDNDKPAQKKNERTIHLAYDSCVNTDEFIKEFNKTQQELFQKIKSDGDQLREQQNRLLSDVEHQSLIDIAKQLNRNRQIGFFRDEASIMPLQAKIDKHLASLSISSF